jgi:hypothetical protein
MTKKNFHSVPWNGDWAVKKEGVNKPISVHRTQATAEDKTRILAKKAEAEAVYHNRQGIIKDKDSYGNDDCPPKDRKL